MTPNWYSPSMYNIVKQDGKDVHLVIKPDPELRREFGTRLDPRRAHGRGILFRSALDPTAAADRTDGLALWPDAADELGRRARPRGARDGGGDRRPRRGRPVRLGFRSRRRRRRLRKHLGHRKALFRRDEDQEHPHSQSPGLQLRGACDPRHGGWRTQQLLRGRRTRRHDRRGRNQRAGDADQLFPQPLGAEPSRRVARQEECAAARRSASAGADHFRRSAAHGDGERLRGRSRQGQGASPAINSGTDLALFNAWLTYIADKGWVDKDFIAASTKDFDKAVGGQQDSLEGRREDHRPQRRRHSEGGRMDRATEGRRRARDGRCSPTRRA